MTSCSVSNRVLFHNNSQQGSQFIRCMVESAGVQHTENALVPPPSSFSIYLKSVILLSVGVDTLDIGSFFTSEGYIDKPSV
ncbi:hypothetical protein GcM1_179006 [Golovinomyces cichoracearum]|uniref:Uncharacterized protein n=1 Tax=Golovinomyces cichoracearum TaxID=62708 RepID=A0A420J4I7_9PEZI|nr:hypothetical protein GcM1_179006 [Golovinomyces cichoracearum]